MKYDEVKFLLKFDEYDPSAIGDVFNNSKCFLNWQFGENFKADIKEGDVDYQIMDVSDLNSADIEKITDSFFSFEFEDISNVSLYRFLVLKNNNKCTLLAIIHPLIFSYSSVNDFYELFNNINSNSLKNDLNLYYGDVKDYLNSQDYKEDLNYWKSIKSQAGNYVKFHNLKSNNYKTQKIEIENKSVLDFIKNHDSSVFNFYACAFALYLSRINRQKGCLLKTSIPSNGADLKTILKLDLNAADSFTEYLHRFNSIYDEAVSHTKVSIENYLDEDLSYYSIYDFSGLNENICIYNGEDSALTLNIYDGHLDIVYNVDLFSDIYIQHMVDNIKSMVTNIVEFPNHLLKDVNILSDNEEKLLHGFCKGECVDVNEKLLIAEYFRRHALENPDAIAIDDGVNQVSYGEMEKSSNSIANDLFENYNISQGSHVGLMLPRTYHFPEMVLALNKLGAAFVPIDLIYPAKRIKHMLEISEADCIVTTEDISDKFDLNIDMICIEDLNSNDDVDIEIRGAPDDLFSIMFTSGTTGLPKGVKISNCQLNGSVVSFKNIFSFSQGDFIGCYLSFSFIASYVIYLAFVFGGGCRIFNETEQKDILSLIGILKEKPMNSLFLPPALPIPVLESGDIKLDYLVLAGAKLKELSKKERNTQLINFYGTTEIIFGVTKVYDFKDIDDDNLSIGRPVANTNVYILDEHSNQMPIGVPGEICVSSDYMSPGYYNDPELTQKFFVDNPYCDGENNRIMYRTGDIGFYNFDGDIEIIGREDDQMSVRGFRIESKEILNIINSIPEIENVYLDVENDTLALYYTTNAEIGIDHIKEKLTDELPDYMVPSLSMELEEIPLNMNGKIDKARLKKMSKVNAEINIDDEVLAGVVDTFKEVLDADLVLVDDDFVELGGNSLSAMNLQILLGEKFHVNISSQEIIGLSTPNNISDYIKSNYKSFSESDVVRYTFDDVCPLCESQLNVYLDENVNPMGTAYNNPFKITFKEGYSVGEIKNALIKLFDAFPVLKARVVDDGGILSFVFDANPEINEGFPKDADSFVRAFESDKCLSRFLIVEDGVSVTLCADFHHLIFDGTSAGILLNKLNSILNEGNVDFADNGVLRQISFEESLDSSYAEDAKGFFDKMLADREEAYDLLPSPTAEDDESEFIESFDIDAETLGSFMQANSLTHNQLFAGIFAYTLSRFAGSDKVLFNLIEDGRGHIDLSESVGMFVKTLPVLMDCKNQDIDSFFKYSSGLINSVMKYDLYPFRVLANEYDLNSNMLFQYSHNLFSNAVNNDFSYEVCELSHDPVGDLSFFIFNNGDGFTIRILHSQRYSKSFVERFAESFKLILHGIMEVNELKDIIYVSEDDINLLDSYNRTEHELDYGDVLDAFNDNLAKHPDNLLVSCNDVSYSYGEGAFIADKIAKRLADLGVEGGDCVAFLTERSELYMFSVLGIMSAGAVYVPLDDALPDERIQFMLNDCEAKAVIVSDSTHGRIKNMVNDKIRLLNISDIVNGEITTLSSLPVDYNDLACILYTSGTTGIPKGVKITRKSIVNVVASYTDDYGLDGDDVYGLFSAIGFDVSNFIIAAVLYSGSCLSVVPEDIRLNMAEMNEYFVNQGVTHAFINTQVAKLFMQGIEDTSLDVLFVAGEKLGMVESPDDYELIDGFGPTEAFAFISSIRNRDKIIESSVGFLNYNTKVYVLDNEDRRVPVGAVGELCISGYQVAEGYLNREEETQKAFTGNPFDDDGDYGMLYHTGDMVRVLPDGTLGFAGRRDGQVKIRGNRVELSEVESVIREIDYVEDVTVQTIENMDNNELVAYVVSDKTDNLKESICRHVSVHKPDYMVPSFVIRLDEIPLNVNGKVDRHALPEVDIDSLNAEYVAPATETERKIVSAFEQVFNLDKIGIYDDFTRLGGDSLIAIRLLGLLEDYNISAADILSLRTPYAIANNISNVSLDLNIYSLESGCPLNESQLNVYLDIISNNKTDSYLLPLFMEISNRYGADAIIGALNKIFEVHPILGMCVSDEFEVPYLVKGSKPQIVIQSNPNEEYVAGFLSEPFDLHDCLCRFLIVENDMGHSLFAVFHHLIFDALSESVFKKDMETVLDGGNVDVDDSFLKVSAFSQQIQSTDDYRGAEEFFSSMLADNDDAGLLLDSVLPDGPGYSRINLDTDYNKLNSFLQNHNVSENILFSGVFAYALSRFTGSEKALFNILENGRDRFSNYDSVGMFVNTLPVLVDCKNRDIHSFMEYISDIIYGVMRHSYYPFRVLANRFDINADILFQFIPEWIGGAGAFDEFGDEKNDLLSNQDDLIADLTVEVVKKGNNYILSVLYSGRYSRDFTDRFMESYKLILQGILNAVELGDISYISDEDTEFLDSYNLTEHDLDYGDVLDAFNDNLAKHPDNALVSYRDVSYSYGEGAFIATQTAEKLAELGVETGDCVGFLLPRSELYMFSVLGIMSMGAVWVPLDDSHPDERIQFIINDCEVKAVIVSDSTYGRAENMVNGNIELLNISDIVKSEIGTLSSLPAEYNDVACILYTSGTTGIPKGVKITRKSIVNVVASYSDVYGLDSDDVYGLFSAIGFDAGTFTISAVLYSGACFSVIPDDIRLNMVEMNNYFITHGVTHVFLTTQVAKLFMQSIEDTSLDILLIGGEKLGEFESPDDYMLVDSYGPTESFAFMLSVDNRDKIDESSVGHLNYNTKVYVLDNEDRRVPVGAVGELCISGYQIAEGYLNREEETQNSFTGNHFDDNGDYSRLYHTGDMVRVLPDGTLGFAGRRDSQVKIRGNRVELSEIESIIREIDYVENVTVQTVKHDFNNELVVYVVLKDGSDADCPDSIREYVSKHKPEYMVPSFVIELDEIPLNINGKVDRKSLPDVDFEVLHSQYAAPETETERQIVNAFEAVFNQKGIGLNDDFIHLGGDSILAIRLLSLFEKEGLSCSARDILNYKTPYLIAQNVEKITKISYDKTEGEVDLLPIQSYFFNQVNSNDFSQEFILKSKADLDLNILQRAFDELTNVHDMLRATYKYKSDNAVQEILPLNSDICQINEYSIDDLDKCIRNIIKKSKISLDINNELIKISLIHCDDGDYVVFVIHHLIIDGISWSTLIDDLTYIYNQIKNNAEIDLLRPYPYKNWVEDVRNLVDDISDEEKRHWTEINGLLDDSLIRGKSKGFLFNVDALFDVDNQLMLSEEEYLALAISRAYKKTYGKSIIFNREVHGRDESLADVGRTIGWFTSQFPVIVDVTNDYDEISLTEDVYRIKTAFKDVKHLGLNYESLIYSTQELEYKHCPVTFNFLSREFSFENDLFKSVNMMQYSPDELQLVEGDSDSFGIGLNVSRIGDSYIVGGDYAECTYLGDGFEEFVDNVKYELKFIGEFKSDAIACPLSESQLGIYLDEKVNEMGTAYSTPGVVKCDDYSIDEIKRAIRILIDRHPVLRGRVVDGEVPLLICDSYPPIKVVETDDYFRLIEPFDLNDSLSCFYIIGDNGSKSVFYNMHHIICDATCRTIINNELFSALNGGLDDEIDLGFAYAGRESFESKFESIYDESHEFYRDILCDIDEVGSLLDDVCGETNQISLPVRGIRDDMEEFCLKSGITVGNLFNAVFAYTYSRFIGSEKAYYTFTEHGRHQDYAQNALGMYVRTIPLVVNCKNRSVGEYLSYVSDLILDSMKYSDYPFRLLAREFNLNKNVSFEYNSNLNDVSRIGDELVIEDMDIGLVSDFLCIVNDLTDGYLVSVQSCDKYSDDMIIRFLNSFKQILIEMLDKEELSDIIYTCESDLILLDSYNLTEHDLDYSDVLDAFNDNLSRCPDDTLVSFKDVSYSYGECAFIAAQTAEKLAELGVEGGDCVAFLTERSELYMLSILSVMSAGAVYVPLDDTLPDERIQFILNDCGAKAVIVSDSTYVRAENLVGEKIGLLNISDIVNGEIGMLSSLPADYNDLACILYTSGTTGIPKGVKITRKSLVNVADSYIDVYGLDSNDVYGLFSAIGFDVSNFVIAAVLYSGSCLSVVPEDIRMNMVDMNNYFISQGVTHSFLTTQVGKLFMQSVDSTSLDVLLVAGEKLGDFESPEGYELVDGFGPTEAFAYMSSIRNCDKIIESSVGFLNYNTKVYVLDNEGRRVPVGAVGELCIAGYQVAEGYLNREDETQKAFTKNPFDSNGDYSILYHTGDMVRVLPDASLGIVGRRDGQVKIRGNRVELAEVESVIREMGCVEDVTVQTIKNMDNNELVAYVVSDKTDNLKDSVCEYVSERKPDYMVPSFVIVLDNIPLTVNGKVDKHRLPAVDLDALRKEYVAPRNEKEKEVVEAFEKAFNLEKVSIYDDFVHLGGDSLTAIRLLQYIESGDIVMADILRLRTPEAIAGNIDDISFDLDIYSLESGCPLNSSQINVFSHVILFNLVDAYQIPSFIKISKSHSLDDILDALDKLLQAHPILSMVLSDKFEENEEKSTSKLQSIKVVLKIAKKNGIGAIMSLVKSYGFRNLGGLFNMLKISKRLFRGEYPYLIKGPKPPVSVQPEFDKDIIFDFLSDSLNLYSNLSKFMIVESEDSYYLFYMVHHIIFDAISSGVFRKDFRTLLDGGSVDMEDTFLKVSAFTHQIRKTEKFDEAMEFYESVLGDVDEAGLLPEDNSSKGYAASIDALEFDKKAFNAFLNNAEISENILFAAVLSCAISKVVENSKVSFTMIENGRDRFNENFIGMTSNVMPLLVDCKDQSIGSFLGNVSDIIYGAMKYSYYPLISLYQKFDFRVKIMFQFVPDWVSDGGENVVDILSLDFINDILSSYEDFLAELFVQIVQEGDEYNMVITHTKKYSDKMIDDFKHYYMSILSDIINSDISSDLSDILK